MPNTQEDPPQVPDSLPRSRIVVVGTVAAVVLFHILATAIYNIPSTTFQRDQRPQTFAYQYMRPFFHQDYRIFAPDPASEDRKLQVRAWILDEESGEHYRTEWATITDFELSQKHRQWARKQFSIYAAEQLASAYRSLNEEQREIARTNFHRSSLEDLREQLVAAAGPDQTSSIVSRFMQQTRYSLAYGTAVARVLWGDEGPIEAIQVRAVYYPVVRWEDRNNPSAPKPEPRYYAPAWRAPLDIPGMNNEKFADVLNKWAESAQ